MQWLEGPPEDFTHDLILVCDANLPAPGGLLGVAVGTRIRDNEGSEVAWFWKHPNKAVSTKKENRLTKWGKYRYIPLKYPE